MIVQHRSHRHKVYTSRAYMCRQSWQQGTPRIAVQCTCTNSNCLYGFPVHWYMNASMFNYQKILKLTNHKAVAYESYYMQFQPLSLLHVLRIWRLTSSSAILARQTIHKTFILFDFGKIWTVLFPNVATKLHVVIQE